MVQFDKKSVRPGKAEVFEVLPAIVIAAIVAALFGGLGGIILAVIAAVAFYVFARITF